MCTRCCLCLCCTKCCEVKSVCGRNLREGVAFVAIASMVISVVILMCSTAYLVPICVSDELINSHPLSAMNLIFSLVSFCLSAYTIVISALLLWQARKTKGKIFICSLWYVSHLSILTLYCLLFTAKVVVCFVGKHYVNAALTALIGILYESTFIYFAVVVNSFLHSLNLDRYL